MAAVLRQHPRYRLPGQELLLAYYERRGDARQTARCRDLVKLAAQRERSAVALVLRSLDEGKFAPSSLAPDAREVLQQSIAVHGAVRKAWLVEGSAKLEIEGSSVSVVAHVLALTLDPVVLAGCDDDEPAVRRRFKAALASLIAADEIAVVRTFFTTEAHPAVLEAPETAILHAA